MKYIFLLVFVFCGVALSAQPYTYVLHNDSLFLKNIGLNDSMLLVNKGNAVNMIKDSSKFQTTMSVGTPYATSPLTVTNFNTAFPTPQAGTIVHLVSDAITNGRINFDTYINTASKVGSNYFGRKARGTAAAPTAAIADDILVTIGGDGYGGTGFHNISLASITMRSEGTMSNTDAPTYMTFSTTPAGTVTNTERMRIKSNGSLQLFTYGVGILQSDASGNITSGALAYTETDPLYTANGQTKTKAISDSNALATAINGKEPTITAGTTSQYWRGDKTWQTLPANNAPNVLTLTAAISSIITTPAAISGWSFAVTAGKKYSVKVFGSYQSGATTTGGILGVSLSAGAGTIIGELGGHITQASAATKVAATIRSIGALGLSGSSVTTTGVSVINSPHFIGGDFIFDCTTSGTLNMAWGSEVALSAAQINIGSVLIYTLLN